jgi:hypothetical protein
MPSALLLLAVPLPVLQQAVQPVPAVLTQMTQKLQLIRLLQHPLLQMLCLTKQQQQQQKEVSHANSSQCLRHHYQQQHQPAIMQLAVLRRNLCCHLQREAVASALMGLLV